MADRDNKTQMLLFLLSGQHFCISAKEVKEVTPPSLITKIPHSLDLVRGIMNLRGDIIVLIDLKKLFGLKALSKTAPEKVIILNNNSGAGIMADEIKGMIDVRLDQIQPPLATLKGNLLSYVSGQVEYNDNIVTLLYLKNILDNEKTTFLKKENSSA